MATRTYELTYIINPVISDDHTKNLVRRVNKLVEENGGSVLEVDEWGNQRLSPFCKHRCPCPDQTHSFAFGTVS